MQKWVVSNSGKTYWNSFKSNCFSVSCHIFLPLYQQLPGWILGLSTGRAGSGVWLAASQQSKQLPTLALGIWKLTRKDTGSSQNQPGICMYREILRLNAILSKNPSELLTATLKSCQNMRNFCPEGLENTLNAFGYAWWQILFRMWKTIWLIFAKIKSVKNITSSSSSTSMWFCLVEKQVL